MISINAEYYDECDLKNLGLKRVGTDVRVAKNCTLSGIEYIEFGSHVRIDSFCVITASRNGVTFGDFVHVGAGVVIIGGGGVRVSDFVTISHQCTLLSKTDDFSGESLVGATVPDCYRNVYEAVIVCERYSFLGVNSVVFPGVTLYEGACIGASSLVRHSVDPWKVYAGNPLRFLYDRKRDISNISPEQI